MTKRIFRSIFSVSAVILVISIGLIMGLLYGHFGDQLEKELKQEAVYLAIAVENDGVESLNRLSKTGERVTLIDEDGTVLYDNKADAGTMENHQDREEVQAAQKSGEGYASRTSATLGEKTVYYALRLENGQILRVSSTQYTIVRILGGLIQPILVMIFLMLILSLAAAFHSSRKIVEPLNKLNLDDPKMNDTYDEITPLLTRINKQQKTIREQLSEAKRQQEEFAIITNNMSEGLLVIDKQTEILSCNTSAVKLLGAKKAVTDQSVLTMNRSEPFRKAVEGVLKGKHMADFIELEDGVRQLIANPVLEDGKVTGAVLLLVDVTEKMQRESLRREFTANVSHELRTPLTSISGFAEIMKNGMVPPADMGKFAEKIYNEAQRLIALVQDIIKLSKLDEKDTSLCEEEVELDALVQEACERLQPAAERKRVTLSAETEPILFRGVKQVLSEMIYNLCDNAIRYNKEGGAVFVTLKQKADRISLTVRDTGIGIAKEEQGRIFERFYRVDASRSAENGGTGLGLSIVKHGAALHNGKIFIESEIGNGTSIEISLPYSIN